MDLQAWQLAAQSQPVAPHKRNPQPAVKMGAKESPPHGPDLKPNLL